MHGTERSPRLKPPPNAALRRGKAAANAEAYRLRAYYEAAGLLRAPGVPAAAVLQAPGVQDPAPPPPQGASPAPPALGPPPSSGRAPPKPGSGRRPPPPRLRLLNQEGQGNGAGGDGCPGGGTADGSGQEAAGAPSASPRRCLHRSPPPTPGDEHTKRAPVLKGTRPQPRSSPPHTINNLLLFFFKCICILFFLPSPR